MPLYLAGLWILYYAMHSLLAANSVKDKTRKFFGGFYRYYRLLYNLVATAGFFVLMGIQIHLKAPRFYLFPQYVIFAGYLLVSSGLIVILAAFKSYDINEFVGFSRESGNRLISEKLVVKGLNKVVRHPLYFGIILMLGGYLLINFSLPVVEFDIISLLYIIIGAKLEERKLVRLFGQTYLDYRKKTKMLIPFVA